MSLPPVCVYAPPPLSLHFLHPFSSSSLSSLPFISSLAPVSRVCSDQRSRCEDHRSLSTSLEPAKSPSAGQQQSAGPLSRTLRRASAPGEQATADRRRALPQSAPAAPSNSKPTSARTLFTTASTGHLAATAAAAGRAPADRSRSPRQTDGHDAPDSARRPSATGDRPRRPVPTVLGPPGAPDSARRNSGPGLNSPAAPHSARRPTPTVLNGPAAPSSARRPSATVLDGPAAPNGARRPSAGPDPPESLRSPRPEAPPGPSTRLVAAAHAVHAVTHLADGARRASASAPAAQGPPESLRSPRPEGTALRSPRPEGPPAASATGAKMAGAAHAVHGTVYMANHTDGARRFSASGPPEGLRSPRPDLTSPSLTAPRPASYPMTAAPGRLDVPGVSPGRRNTSPAIQRPAPASNSATAAAASGAASYRSQPARGGSPARHLAVSPRPTASNGPGLSAASQPRRGSGAGAPQAPSSARRPSGEGAHGLGARLAGAAHAVHGAVAMQSGVRRTSGLTPQQAAAAMAAPGSLAAAASGQRPGLAEAHRGSEVRRHSYSGGYRSQSGAAVRAPPGQRPGK